MNGKHTPGPWHTDKINAWNVWSADCKVAKTFDVGQADSYREPPEEERIANARLIAAAPKMLAELEAAAAIFRAYEAMHQAKGTDEGIGKAKRNRAFAESLERTIAEAKGEAA